MVRLFEIPNAREQTIVVIRPAIMVGLRPKMSEALPHGTAMILCKMENTNIIFPAHFATSFSGTPKLLIISGRYGFTLVKTIGSAKRAKTWFRVSRCRRQKDFLSAAPQPRKRMWFDQLGVVGDRILSECHIHKMTTSVIGDVVSVVDIVSEFQRRGRKWRGCCFVVKYEFGGGLSVSRNEHFV